MDITFFKWLTFVALIIFIFTLLLTKQVGSLIERNLIDREAAFSQSQAARLSRTTEKIFNHTLEEAKMVGLSLAQKKPVPDFDSGIVAIEVQGAGLKSATHSVIKRKLHPSFINSAYYQTVITNSSAEGAAALVTLGAPLKKNDQGKVDTAVFVDASLDQVQNLFNHPDDFSESFLVDNGGVVISSANEKWVAHRHDLSANPVVNAALMQRLQGNQKIFSDQITGEKFVGAYRRLFFDGAPGPIVVVQIPLSKIQIIAAGVVKKIKYIMLALFFTCLGAIAFFTTGYVRSLTALSRAATELAIGNFDARIALKSRGALGKLENAFDQMTDGLKKAVETQASLNKFKNTPFIRKINEGEISLEAARAYGTVLFVSSVAVDDDFINSEKPDTAIDFLSDFYNRVSKTIIKNGGFVDKTIGQTVIAVFGLPGDVKQHEKKAVTTALALRALFKDSKAKISMSVHSGPLLMGEVIFQQGHKEFSVFGKTLSVAARLESQTLEWGEDLLISFQTQQALGKEFTTDPIKSRRRGEKMYRVL